MLQDSTSIEERLRQAGLQVMPQRRAVCSVSEDGENGHLTVDQVFERDRRELPELTRATVYNSLSELVRAGLRQVVEGRGALLCDPNLDPNHLTSAAFDVNGSTTFTSKAAETSRSPTAEILRSNGRPCC